MRDIFLLLILLVPFSNVRKISRFVSEHLLSPLEVPITMEILWSVILMVLGSPEDVYPLTLVNYCAI